MMKRIICFLSIITLLFISSSCAEKTPPSIVGTWEYSNHSELKDLLSDQVDDSYFYKVYYQFNEDGTGSTWIDANPEFVYTFEYNFDGKKLSVALSDGSVQELKCEFHETYFYVSDGKEDMKFVKIK